MASSRVIYPAILIDKKILFKAYVEAIKDNEIITGSKKVDE